MTKSRTPTLTLYKVTKEKKTDLYNRRLKDDKHHARMFIDPQFFKILEENEVHTPHSFLIKSCKKFNEIAKQFTKDIGYEVILNRGIPETAADFLYQWNRLIAFATEKGQYFEVMNLLKNEYLYHLFSSMRYPKRDGYVVFDIEMLEKFLPEIMGIPSAVLMGSLNNSAEKFTE